MSEASAVGVEQDTPQDTPQDTIDDLDHATTRAIARFVRPQGVPALLRHLRNSPEYKSDLNLREMTKFALRASHALARTLDAKDRMYYGLVVAEDDLRRVRDPQTGRLVTVRRPHRKSEWVKKHGYRKGIALRKLPPSQKDSIRRWAATPAEMFVPLGASKNVGVYLPARAAETVYRLAEAAHISTGMVQSVLLIYGLEALATEMRRSRVAPVADFTLHVPSPHASPPGAVAPPTAADANFPTAQE